MAYNEFSAVFVSHGCFLTHLSLPGAKALGRPKHHTQRWLWKWTGVGTPYACVSDMGRWSPSGDVVPSPRSFTCSNGPSTGWEGEHMFGGGDLDDAVSVVDVWLQQHPVRALWEQEEQTIPELLESGAAPRDYPQ